MNESPLTPDLPIPERKGAEPSPGRVLRIKNEYPGAIYQAIEDQYGRKNIIDQFVGYTGEKIGFAISENPVHPLQRIETEIHGNLMPVNLLDWKQEDNIPDKPVSRKEIGEQRKEFNIETIFYLPNHTFIDEARAQQLIEELKKSGYRSRLEEIGNGNRELVIATPEGSFDLSIGWENPDSLIQYHQRQIEKYKKERLIFRGLEVSEEEEIKRVLESKDKNRIHLQITNSHPGLGPSGIPQESKEQVIAFLGRSKELSEAVGAALVQILAPGKRFPELRMDWLPPKIVEEMEVRTSSEVVGRVEPTTLVETKIKEDFGLERLIGLPDETTAELRRIADRLREPQKAIFMKKYGFKQSNGAVFWGPTGTGKTLAGEALAQEAGCQRIVLKVDEYLTAYIHESARQLGEKLREIKTQASKNERPLIVQIDEADTILMPVFGNSSTLRDAAEVRAALLREFQEPSNVYFILTTNLDPRDPTQADSAITRNQRLGDLVAFGLPDPRGRKEIFEKETKKREGNDLIWEGIDFKSLAASTDGFSPADIQEVLSIAVEKSYDSQTGGAFVSQEHLEEAVNLIKARKLMEERIKKPIGFARR